MGPGRTRTSSAPISSRLSTRFSTSRPTRLAPLGTDAAGLVAEGRAAVSGGKRFRAAFCYWGFRAAVREDYDERAVLRAAAALELLHASALVHDDLMDASDTRRGRPATHRGFAALHREQSWPGDPEQYGAAAAILLGDLLLSWSDELLRHCGLPAATGSDRPSTCSTRAGPRSSPVSSSTCRCRRGAGRPSTRR